MNLSLGKTSSSHGHFTVPLDLVTQTSTIVGIRGSGKTNTAVDLAEELLDAGQQVIVVDPLDVWWGLRSSADGRSGAYPIVLLGGDRQDLPLEATAGKVIAEFAVLQRVSLILSTRHLSKNQQRQFVGDFAERIYELKGVAANRTPLHLVFDEADLFAPQRIQHGHERLFGAIDQLVRRGRSSGIGVTLITQRPAVLNKDVLTQSEMLVCHRTIGPQDRAAIKAWVEVHDVDGQADKVLGSLHELATGEAWIWSPTWLKCLERVKIRARRTFDSSATPKAGQVVQGPRKAAAVDLAKLRDAMAATIEKAKADDPRELRRKISELEVLLGKATRVVAVDKQEVQRHVEAAVSGYQKTVGRVVKDLKQAREHFSEVMSLLARSIGDLTGDPAVGVSSGSGLGSGGQPGSGPVAARRFVPQPPPTPAGRPVTRAPQGRLPAADDHADVGGGGLRRMLVALAQRPQGLSHSQLALRAGIASKGGTFRTYVGQGKTRGWIDGARDRLVITEAGLAALGSYEPLPSGRALLEYWLAHPRVGRGSGAARMLEVLMAHCPSPMSREDLAQASGIESAGGTFRTYLGKLKTLELVTEEGDGLRLSEELA